MSFLGSGSVKKISAETNTQATIEELKHTLLSMRPASCQWKVGDIKEI
jgi:hypothetical protein